MREGGFYVPHQVGRGAEGDGLMRDIEREEAEAKLHRRAGEFLAALGTGRGLGGLAEGQLRGFSVRLPTEEEPGALLVVRAEAEGDLWVAFIGAYRVVDAVIAWRKRDKDNKMKWREDQPWAGRA